MQRERVVVLGSPNFGGRKRRVYVAVPSHSGRVALQLAYVLNQMGNLSAMPDHEYAYFLFMPEGFRPVEYARNLCVQAFLADPQADRLLFIDDDMKPPVNWAQMLDLMEARSVPAVSGLAFGWQGSGATRAPQILTVMYDRNAETGVYETVTPKAATPFTVDAVGAACLLLRRSLVEKVAKPWFKTEYGDLGQVLLGEDVYFCQRVNEAGEKFLIDPTVQFGHEKSVDLLDVATYGMSARRGGEQYGRTTKEDAA